MYDIIGVPPPGTSLKDRHISPARPKSALTSRAGVENRIFVLVPRYRNFEYLGIRNGQKDEFGGQSPELVLLTVPNIREMAMKYRC
jgi:hypothetical protein